ncbi:hypothetical protein DL93DRAFT_2225940 [Clavulina sp. PMI_390]|nr:hypothetical protein DL93DRAFT_2225940 [Clavulina sp. PMI_390]
MALNWAMLESNGSPVPLPGEKFINVFRNADFSLAAPSSESSSGPLSLRATGNVHVSAHRLVFVQVESGAAPSLFATLASTSTQSSGELKSLSIPLHHIIKSEFKQPFFSANYLSLLVQPVAEGGLIDRSTVEIRFNDQGLFPFVEMLDQMRNRAIARIREAREATILPAYVPPPNSSANDLPTPSVDQPTPPPQATPENDLPPAYTI